MPYTLSVPLTCSAAESYGVNLFQGLICEKDAEINPIAIGSA